VLTPEQRELEYQLDDLLRRMLEAGIDPSIVAEWTEEVLRNWLEDHPQTTG
jgi:hypothetical protein